jgi:methyl-CpG-binding domain protein 4
MVTMRDDLMVQEQVSTPWQHMVGVICLNMTNRKQVKRVLPGFFARWPGPEQLLRSRLIDIENEIRELGMFRTRAIRLLRMSIDYMKWDGVDAKELYGIGQYGSDSYEIFWKQNYSIKPADKELKKYLEKLNERIL